MEKYIQADDQPVIGEEVKTFPLGIKEAFGNLLKNLGAGRKYYGISWLDKDGKIKYYAVASQSSHDEVANPGYERLTIPRGEYHTISVLDWMTKTDSIKDVFQELTAGRNPDISHPCIEWYKSDHEMLCMFKAD